MTDFWRIDVMQRPGQADPAGQAILRTFHDFGVAGIRSACSARVFLLELMGDRDIAERVACALLADPVTERFEVFPEARVPAVPEGHTAFEVHPRPGVMDPVAASTQTAIRDLGVDVRAVRTGRRYVLGPQPSAGEHPRIIRLLGNESIEEVYVGGKPAGPAPAPIVHEFMLRHIPVRGLSEDGLQRLSRDGHLFLSPAEMNAIQARYRELGREPTDLELETLAQTWSEHCVHKTLKSAVHYRGAPMPGASGTGGGDGSMQYSNLLKDTIVRATQELMAEGRGPTCLSVFQDNAGIIAFDDRYGIAFKVETHNHPSAIEPYGGAATGVGGCIRDVIGCGLGAKPIANTDIFCVAPPDWPIDQVPRGIIHPKSVLRGVVAGVRDYGNRMGIPTINGAVHFDPRYLGNPLVFCGCVGLIPRDRIEKAARPGDLIVLVGGRTGRDGIHGATFSSAELTDSHADEFSHAVQIGNAIEEKKVLDVILQARDYASGCLYSAITDCGAGGLSSAVGEMAAELGADVDLEKVPLKYEGLRYDEIWISESQERMVLAVPPGNVEALRSLFSAEDVEASVIGRFNDAGRLVVRYRGNVVGDLSLGLLHDGLPKQTRVAEWWPDENPAPRRSVAESTSGGLSNELKRHLSNPTIASKEWIVRQYDHEVQGRSVIKPLVGRGQSGPGDAAVIRPRLDSQRGIAIGCGLCPQLSDHDPYWMAVAAIDEAIRNVVCVGGDPTRTAILDNFCWGRTDDPRQMGALVRACQGCYDAAKAYGVPFISGKDSLNNEFALDPAEVELVSDGLRALGGSSRAVTAAGRIAIPGTLLISAVALMDDVAGCVTMDLKGGRTSLVMVGMPEGAWASDRPMMGLFDIRVARQTHLAVAKAIRDGVAVAVHDVSEGGPLVACAEMMIAGHRGGRYVVPSDARGTSADVMRHCFVELAGVYLVESTLSFDECRRHFAGIPVESLGTPGDEGSPLEVDAGSGAITTLGLHELEDAWRAPLHW